MRDKYTEKILYLCEKWESGVLGEISMETRGYCVVIHKGVWW